MPTFHYKAKKGPQDIVESTIQAKTKEEAISKISSLGYVPVRVVHSDKVADATASESKPGLRPRLTKRVKSRDITMFIEQLASLVRSKIPVFEAINILATQTDSPELKKIIATISAELKDGKTLSGSLSRYPHVFPQLLVNMVNAGCNVYPAIILSPYLPNQI